MAVLTNIPNNTSARDWRDTVNALIKRIAALEAAGVPVATPAPAFTTQPSITPTSGTAGSTVYAATPGTVSNGAVVSRAWLLNGTAISTGVTALPASSGTLAYQETASGPGGTTTSTVQVAAVTAATVTPTPTPSFISQPSISPSTGTAGATTFTATAGNVSNGSITARSWTINGTVISTGITAAPASSGTLTYQETATGSGGTTQSTVQQVTVATAAAAAPAFTSQPTVSPSTGTAGTTTYTATPGAVSNGSITSRAWALNGSTISTGLTAAPASAGTLTYQEFATGTGGSASSSVLTRTVSAATPALTLSPASLSIASDSAAGTLISNISNVPAGVTPSVTPNDGRLVIAGSASAGWKVVRGMSALSAGQINFTVAATGANSASGVLTVTAAANFDPATMAKTAAMYSALDAQTVTSTQWLDRSSNARHGTKVGTVDYVSSSAVANGYPALVWADTQPTEQGYDLPGMTVQEAIFVCGYKDGVDDTFDVSSTFLSGLSASGGNPRIATALNGSTLQGGGEPSVIAERAFIDGGQVTAGLPTKTSALLPMGLKVLNFQPVNAYTETGWKLGYNSKTAGRNWQGPMVMVLLFSQTLTAKERAQVYSYINSKLARKLPVPSWSITKTQQVIGPQGSASTAPPYYPQPLDMRGVPGAKADYYALSSGDHITNSGIYLHLIWGDPAAPTRVISYDQALAEGLFNDVPNKPAGNPIFNYTVAGESTETPQVKIVDGVFVLTFQQGKVGRGQETGRALCTDGTGLNYVFDKFVLKYTLESGPGNGSTTYFRWWDNPFPNLINPATGVKWKYAGYSLHGDTGKGFFAQWATDDPVYGDWTRTCIMMRRTGRATNNSRFVSWISVDMAGAHPVPGGISMLASIKVPGASAGTGGSSEGVEIIVDTKGQNLLGMPQSVLVPGAAGSFDSAEIDTLWSVIHNDPTKRSIMYGSTDSANLNSAGGAIGDLDLTSVAQWAPLLPAIPASPTKYDVDFKTGVGLPSWLTATYRGTVPPVLTPTSLGLEITGSTGTVDAELMLRFNPAAYDLTNADFIEMDIWGLSTISTDRSRYPMFGLVAPADGGQDAITDGIYMSNGFNTGGDLTVRQVAAGAIVASSSPTYIGVGNQGGGDIYDNARAPKRLGFRFFPKSGKYYVTGENQDEFDIIALNAGVNKTVALSPVFGVRFKGTSVKERIERITVRVAGSAAVITPPADTTAPVVTSAATGNVVENQAYTATLTANETVTWSKRTGADSALFVLSGNTLTMSARDYEMPTDADANNTYVCNLTATDAAGNATNFTHTVTVTDVAEGGGTTAATFQNRYQASSTSNASTYSFATVPLGTEGATRKLRVIGTFRAAAANASPPTATFTPDGGTAVAMTQVAIRKSTYDSGEGTIIGFTLDVPTGSQGTVTFTVPGGAVRAGIDTVCTLNAAATPTTSQTAEGLGGTASAISTSIDKIANGFVFAAAQHSTTSSTYHSSAAEVPSATATAVPVTFTNNNSATAAWTGIANPDVGILTEATGSGGNVVLIMSFAPA